MKKIKSASLLVLAAFIWGAAFTAQTVGMEYIGPFTFNGSRFLIGGLVLLPVIFIRKRLASRHNSVTAGTEGAQPDSRHNAATAGPESTSSKSSLPKRTLKSGIICGIVLATASCFQQIGLLYTTPGKAGFITALYVIMVPICGIFLGRKSTWLLYLSAGLAVVGMYFLCLSEGFSISFGDLLVFICALFFTLHILVIDKFAPDVDGIELSCTQFFTAGIICTVLTLIFEFPFPGAGGPAIRLLSTVKIAESVGQFFDSLLAAAIPILYAGALSCGVAYTLQIVGQKNTPPVIASLLLSLESVFSVITAWIILGDALSVREIIGCCIVFAAIVLAQLPIDKSGK